MTRSTLKEQIRSLALDLSKSKKELRKHMKENNFNVNEQWHILKTKKEYRAMHCAYSLMRGKTLEQIENNVSKENPLDLEMVGGYLKDIKDMDAENDVTHPPREGFALRVVVPVLTRSGEPCVKAARRAGRKRKLPHSQHPTDQPEKNWFQRFFGL